MSILHRSILGAVAAAGLALVASAPAHAQSGVRVGVLTCNVASGFGLIFGSSKLTGTSLGVPEKDCSNVLRCSTTSVARSVMSLSSRFQSASSRSRSRNGDRAMAGSRATNTDASALKSYPKCR